MIRPSPPPSAPSRSLQPAGSSSYALANHYLGLAYRPRATIVGRSTASGRPWPPSMGRSAVSASVSSPSPPCASHACLAHCHAELGTFAEGRAFGDEGLQIAEVVDHPWEPHDCLVGVGQLSLRQGDLHRRSPASNGPWASVRTRTSPPFPLDSCGLGCGVYPGRARHRRRAAAHTGDGAERDDEMESPSGGLSSLPGGGPAAGRLEEAHALAERALALAREHQERGHQAYALRLLGEIARAPASRGRQASPLPAGPHPGRRAGHAPTPGPLPPRSRHSVHPGGAAGEEPAALSTAIHMYRAMEMSLWLPQAEATLAQIGERLQRQS